MTVLKTWSPKSSTVCAFGMTLEEAHANAQNLATEIQSEGHHVHIDELGCKLRDDLYGWNVYVKKIQYS